MNKKILYIIALYALSVMSAFANISNYKLELIPDLNSKAISGKAEIIFSRKLIWNFKTEHFTILSIHLNDKLLQFKNENNQIFLNINNEKKTSKLVINFSVDRSNGLVFGTDYLYSNFSTCSWMPCEELSGERFPFELQMILPGEYKMIASGKLISVKKHGKNEKVHTWKQDQPYSSYLLGFAVGKFYEFEETVGNNKLKYIGILDKPEELKRKFQETPNIIKFFENKSGVSLPNGYYSQVLVPDSEAQEKSSFSLIGKPFLDPILTDLQEDWIIVHELAHQWWGNSITCKNWGHFWLNEGITVFMTAAYKQQKWGESSYQREIELAKKRYQKAIDEKMDKPLTFSGPFPSLQIKRAITYSKAMLFMDELRKLLGEEVFWKAFKYYTVTYNGKLVESRDFQNSFEKSSGKNLSEIFNKWVY